MIVGVFFWVLILLWVVFGLMSTWPRDTSPGPHVYAPFGSNVILFLLLLCLGYTNYGSLFR